MQLSDDDALDDDLFGDVTAMEPPSLLFHAAVACNVRGTLFLNTKQMKAAIRATEAQAGVNHDLRATSTEDAFCVEGRELSVLFVRYQTVDAHVPLFNQAGGEHGKFQVQVEGFPGETTETVDCLWWDADGSYVPDSLAPLPQPEEPSWEGPRPVRTYIKVIQRRLGRLPSQPTQALAKKYWSDLHPSVQALWGPMLPEGQALVAPSFACAEWLTEPNAR